MRTLSRNAFLVFAGDAGARLFGFLAVIHIARVLDPENFGIITIGISVLTYATWFSDMGLMVLGTREIARPYEKRSVQLGDVLFIKLVLSAVVFTGGQAAAVVFIQDAVLRTVIQLYLICLFAEAVFMDWYYKGIQNFLPLSLARVVSAMIYAATLYIFVRTSGDVLLVPVLFLAGLLAALPIVFGWKNREDGFLPRSVSVKRYLPVLRDGVTIGVGGIFAQTVAYLPPLVIGIFGTVADAGIFGAALRVVLFALVVDRVFISLFLPYVSRQWSVGRENLRRALAMIFQWTVIGGFLISLIFTVFSDAIVNLLFGGIYSDAAAVLAIMSWFIALTLINSIFTNTLIATGNERHYLRASFAGGVFSVAAILLLTYRYGLIGTAAAVVLSESAMCIFTWFKFRTVFRIPVLPVLIKASAISVVVYGLFDFFGWQEIYYIPLLPVLYAVPAWLFRNVGQPE
jgi:O-antigen/teichoic acid export membrane protein